MDDPNLLFIGAAKLLSTKVIGLFVGGLGIALSLNVWFVSRLVATQDQIQLAVQELKITSAVTNTKMEQIDSRLDRVAKYLNELGLQDRRRQP